MRARAPAKVNLGLRVRGRRPDGYHEIASLFVPLELADELELEPRPAPGVALRVDGDAAGVPADASNLAWRAARAFLDAAGLPGGVGLRLTKRVPSQAGLGGGSSDAGAVLRLLARLHPGAVAPEALAGLALGLGADVPYFLDPRPAWVGGIGERIRPLGPGRPLPRLALLLVHPGVGLSTAEVYRGWREGDSLTPAGADPSLSGLPGILGRDGRLDAGALARLLVNDLEPAATRLCPAIAELRGALDRLGARAVGMSGSGPTLYGIFEDEAGAQRARTRLGAEVKAQAAARSWVTATLAEAARSGEPPDEPESLGA